MLVLSFDLDGVAVLYPPGQPPIRVMVTSINRGQVKLGFDAPRNVKVLREKLKPRAAEDERGDSDNAKPTGPRPGGN
jgi:carbon storage regulator CsrA